MPNPQSRPRGPVRAGNAQAINITTTTKGELDAVLLEVQAKLKARATMDDIVHAAISMTDPLELARFISRERSPRLKKVRG